MTTITQMAEGAGVLVKAVPRVMNGYKFNSVKARGKVQQAMEEFSYTSNAAAFHTRTEQRLSIGMLYSDPGAGYQAKLNREVLEACSSSRRCLVR